MIISASRRTDIPNYYAEWFLNRLREGFVCVRNPMNIHQISRIELSPEVVDCIVFWTKNPAGMMKHLDELELYPYYFQFTLTGYGTDIEKNIPDKQSVMIPRFQDLARVIGKHRVIWRYDPILFNQKYTMAYHTKAFAEIANSLTGYTEKCVISFVDLYRKNKADFDAAGVSATSPTDLTAFAGELCNIANQCGMRMASCAEAIDLGSVGIEHNSCIDKGLIEQLTGGKLAVKKDRNQRAECGCVESMEVGSYNTCANGCSYCYATFNASSVRDNAAKYDPTSPILCDCIGPEDKVTDRKVKSLLDRQLSFFF